MHNTLWEQMTPLAMRLAQIMLEQALSGKKPQPVVLLVQAQEPARIQPVSLQALTTWQPDNTPQTLEVTLQSLFDPQSRLGAALSERQFVPHLIVHVWTCEADQAPAEGLRKQALSEAARPVAVVQMHIPGCMKTWIHGSPPQEGTA